MNWSKKPKDLTLKKKEECWSTDSTKVKSLPVSVKKLHEISSELDNTSSEEYFKGPDGFHLVNISVLSAAFHLLCCPVSKHGHVELKEDSGPKMGFTSIFLLKCKNQKLMFFEKFYSSSKIEGTQAFDVNRRIVVTTRNIGIGHQALAKFTCVMNMPPPMNENSYRDHVAVVSHRKECRAFKEKKAN